MQAAFGELVLRALGAHLAVLVRPDGSRVTERPTPRSDAIAHAWALLTPTGRLLEASPFGGYLEIVRPTEP